MTEEFLPNVVEYYVPDINIGTTSSANRVYSKTKDQEDYELFEAANPVTPIEYAPISNPTFKGTVTLPSVSALSNDNTGATTSFVNQVVGTKLNALVDTAPQALSTQWMQTELLLLLTQRHKH